MFRRREKIKPRPKNCRILVPFRGSFQNSRREPPSSLPAPSSRGQLEAAYADALWACHAFILLDPSGKKIARRTHRMWSFYEIIHICTAVVDKSEEWSPQLERRSLKKSQGFNGIAVVTGSNPVEALIFFRVFLSNCLNWKIYCDDHSALSNPTNVCVRGYATSDWFQYYDKKTTRILEMARAYGLRPRLWPLLGLRPGKIFLDALKSMSVRTSRPVFSSKLSTRPRTDIFLFLGSPLHC